MSRIKGKDTKPELLLRSLLHRRGYRFRLHPANLPGKPDIVLPKFKTAIFVNGCFWHRHEGCRGATMPKTRTEFWADKFSKTIERDQRKQSELEAMSWHVMVVWECEIKSDPVKTLEKITSSFRE